MTIDPEPAGPTAGRAGSPRRIFGLLAAVAVLSGGALGWLLLQQRADAIAAGEKLGIAFAQLAAEQTLRTLQIVDQTLELAEARLAAASPAGTTPDGAAGEDQMHPAFRALLADRPFIRAMWLLDERGVIVHDSDTGNIGRDLSDRPYFALQRDDAAAGRAATFAISVPFRSRSTGDWSIPTTRTLRRPDGSFAGVLVAALDPRFFDRIWSVGCAQDCAISLFRDDGVLLMRSPLVDRLLGTVFPSSPVAPQLRDGKAAGTLHITSPFDGQSRLVAYRQLTPYPRYFMVVAQTMTEVLDDWWHLAMVSVVGWVAVVAAVAGLMAALVRGSRTRLLAEARYRKLFDAVPYPMALLEPGTRRFLEVNDATLRQYGWSRRELLAMTSNEFYPPGELAKVEALRHRGAATDRPPALRHLRKDGSTLDIESYTRSLEVDGKPAVLVTALDVTERVRMEREREEASERLRQSEERSRLLFESSPYPMLAVDRETQRFVAVNDAAVRQYGWSRPELLAMGIDDIYPPQDVPAVQARRRQVMAALADPQLSDGTQLVQGLRHVTRSGETIDVEMNLRLIEIEGRPVTLVMSRDITEGLRAERARQAAETQARESQERYRLLFESNPYPVFVNDRRTLGFLAVNDAAARLYGGTREELLGMRFPDLYLPEELEVARRTRYSADTTRTVRGLKLRRKDGSPVEVEMAVRLIDYDGRKAALAIVVDVSERIAAEQARLAAEEQLRQSQKMEAVGQLTGGIAHDFNNILTVILANTDALLDEEGLDAAVSRRLERVSQAVLRASELTRQLLAYSRKQPLRPQRTDINELVSATGSLLRRSLGAHIEIESLLADGLWPVSVDRTQLETALVNLCVNARDAMPDGGRLLIETANVVPDAAYVARHPDAAAGEHVMLSVTDTGSGMAPEVAARVFEPFFTTKETGKGTGLGLSMVYGFIKQSKGHIAVDSALGRGTSFRLHLPRGKDGQAESAAPAKAEVAGGRERILVVEDEPQVRANVVQQLASLGYAVAEAADGASGLAAVEAASTAFDLMLTDVVMPGRMNGKALADEVRRRWPATRIVFMSGYSNNALAEDGQLAAGVLLLAKPFRKADLAGIVRQALDAKPRQ